MTTGANEFAWLYSRACRRSALAVWLSSCAASLLAATPLSVVLGAATSGLPQGEAALFEAGGTWLLEVLSQRTDAIHASLVTAAWILIAAVPVLALLGGTLWSALWSRTNSGATFSDALSKGTRLVPRLMVLWALTRVVQGVVLVLGVLLGRTFATVVVASASERGFDLLVLGGGLLGAVLAGLVQLGSWTVLARLTQKGALLSSLVWSFRALRRGAARLAFGVLMREGAGLAFLILPTLVLMWLGNAWPPLAHGFLHQLGFLLATLAHVTAMHSIVEWVRIRSDDFV